MDDRNSIGPPGGDFGATTPNIRISSSQSASKRPIEQSTPGPAQPPPAARKPSRKIWFIVGGGLFLFVVIVAAVLYLTHTDPGFTLIVRGAPPGSDVHIDSISHGVTSADGSIRVTGLKAGRRLVRVSHEGYIDFNTSVSGKDGEEKSITAQVTQGAKKSVAQEIDYNGPMMLVAAGEFIMGDDSHQSNEKPAHKATLPDYYIDKFEVTNEQYKRFCEAKKNCPVNPWWDPNYFNQPTMPVVGVTFAEASAYANWAGKRLPSEEEWEKAASWGPSADKKRMWPWGDSADAGRATLGVEHTTAVGSNPNGASAYGVQDMGGNVFEWVNAFYQPYPGNTATDSNFGTLHRVVRGGHFHADAEDARTTRRIYFPPQFTAAEKKERSWLIGFRCVVSADDPKVQELIRSQK